MSLTLLKKPNIKLQYNLDQGEIWNLGEHFSLILGGSEAGKNITLEKCLVTGRSHSSSNFVTLRLRVHKVYIGSHFENQEDIRFKEISVRYANLEEWAAFKNLDVERNSNPFQLKISYNRHNPITVKNDQYKFEFNPYLSQKYKVGRINLCEIVKITISSTQCKRSIGDFAKIVGHIQDFLTLAIGNPTFPVEIKDFHHNTDIFYPVIGWSHETKKIYGHEMLFTLPKIQGRLSIFINNWLEKANALGPVFDLYFSTLYNPHLYTESTFLSLIQAIETYHRRRFGGKYQADKKYKENLYRNFIEAIPESTNRDFKQSLINGKLKYANEYSLRKRLKELIKYLIGNDLGFLVNKASYKAFINKVYNTRNYLTHYDESLRRKAVKGNELFTLTVRLRAILEIFLLEELGFKPDSIREIILNNRGLRYRLGIEAQRQS